MKKRTKIILAVAAAVIAFLLLVFAAGGAAVSAFSLMKLNSVEQQLAELQTYSFGGSDKAQEDDVRIAGSYVIKSTKHISDAYLSGNSSGLNEKDSETLKMASDVLKKIIKDGMSDYEKELAVYEWMTKELSFDSGMLVVVPETTQDSDNPYGVLKFHNAVCVGYATTFRLFMQMLDIPCMVVHNSELGHSWDLVQLGEGWYHVDIFSDSNVTNYSHFNLNDAMMTQYQSWNTEFFPEAKELKYCYIAQHASEPKDIYAVPAEMRKALEDKAPFVSYRVKTEDDMSALMLIFEQVSSYASYTEELGSIYLDYCNAELDEGYLAYCSFEYTEEESGDDYGNDLDEKTVEKISEAVDKSFSDLTQIMDDDYYDDTEDFTDDEG